MRTIRLIHPPQEPGNRGPSRGMYALQKALREANWPWLKVGGGLGRGDIPWIWVYEDVDLAFQFNEWGWPFIVGPNVLFWNSHEPGRRDYEKRILDAEHCVLQFTESNWYAALIQEHCDRNEAPIVIWKYPIDPKPGEPLDPEFDLLIYLKDMVKGREMLRAREKWPKSVYAVYGRYERDRLLEAARRSRACLYLSTDDRGPLAAAEIALCGCPLVGVERGCPWVAGCEGLGVEVPHFGQRGLHAAIERAMGMSRAGVRLTALQYFDTARTLETIQKALEPIAMEE